MPFNGSGTFTLTTPGQPVVTETTISSTMFNAVLTEFEVGLSNCVTKDGQTTTSDVVPFAAGISVTGTATLNSAVVLNESGGDNDIRIESDTNQNHYRSDAGLFSGVGAHCFGQTASTNSYFVIDPPAISAVADQEYYRFFVESNNAVTIPTGTAAVVTSAYFKEPNITATGTVTNAMTVYISGAPTEGSNNYALLVQSGLTHLNGAVRFGTHSALGGESVTGYITITDNAGNSRKLAVVS